MGIYDFLLDLILDWDNVEDYTKYVREEPELLAEQKYSDTIQPVVAVSPVPDEWLTDAIGKSRLLNLPDGKRKYEDPFNATLSVSLMRSKTVPTIPLSIMLYNKQEFDRYMEKRRHEEGEVY